MAKVDAGAAVMALEAEDRTAPAFQKASQNIEDYKRSIASLDDNLRPLREMLKGGIAVGGAGAGIGAMMESSGALGGALGTLQEKFLGIRTAADEAAGSSFFTEAGSALTDISVEVTKVFGAMAAGVEVARQVAIGWKSAVAMTAEFRNAMAALNAVKTTSAAIETANAAATTASTVATVTATTATGFFATAQTAAAVAVNFLTASLGANPLTAWIVLITAAVAAVGVFIGAVGRIVAALFSEATAAEKAVESTRRLREAHEKERETAEMYADRLERLQEKEKLTAAEKEESAKIVESLNAKYTGLNLRLDETTGKVVDSTGAFVELREVMASVANSDLEDEIGALNARLDELHGKLKDGEISWARWAGTWLTLGYVDNASEIKAQIDEIEKAKEEAEKKRIANANARDAAQIEREKKAREEREKAESDAAAARQKADEARAATIEKMNQFTLTMEKEIDQQNQSELARQISGLKEKIDLQREFVREKQKAGEISAAEAAANLQYLNQLERQRAAQIEAAAAEKAAAEAAARKKEADKVGLDFEESVRRREEQETRKKEDTEITAQIKTDPLAAAKTLTERAATAETTKDAAEQAVRLAIQQAQADGQIDETERARIEELQKRYEAAVAERDRLQAHADAAQAEINSRIDGMMADSGKAPEKAAPLETLNAGSVEAYRKEIELKTRTDAASPEKKSIDEMRKQMEEEAKKQKRRDEELQDLTRQIVENVGGV